MFHWATHPNLAPGLYVLFFVLIPHFQTMGRKMPDIDLIRGEIERMRVQVGRQRKEILQLPRAGVSPLR